MAIGSLALGFQGDYVQINQTAISTTFTTNKYTPNPLFQPCSCDLTALSCDKFCCCDNDCPGAVTSGWEADNSCADVDYKKSSGAPLSQCIEGYDVFTFNQQQGLYQYVTPFNQLFCVKISNSPKMDYYFNQINSLSDSDMSALVANPQKQGLGYPLLEQSSSSL